MVNGRTENVQPPGNCHRFLKFLVSNLIEKSRGIKHVTLGAVSRDSAEVPIETPARNSGYSVFKTPSKSNGEIVIEFRHIEAAKKNGRSNRGVQDLGSSVSVTNPEKTDLRFRQGNQKGRRNGTPAAAGTGEIAVRNGGNGENGKDEKEKEKDVIVIHHQTIINGNDAVGKKTISMPQRPVIRPVLMRDPSNINEKADAFIRSRKKAMEASLTASQSP